MNTHVIMPQMGESITKGTIVKWLKRVGDQVSRNEPLFEISTDKVDAEMPSPTSGTLVEIIVHEGQTVPINTVVAIIGDGAVAVGVGPAAETSMPKSRVLFQTFRGRLTTWDHLCGQAAAFATQVGRERLISISHSEDANEGVVTVWYWWE